MILYKCCFSDRSSQGRIQGERKYVTEGLQRISSDRKATAINRNHRRDQGACRKTCFYFWFYSEGKFNLVILDYLNAISLFFLRKSDSSTFIL